jgi:hypothetical protein
VAAVSAKRQFFRYPFVEDSPVMSPSWITRADAEKGGRGGGQSGAGQCVLPSAYTAVPLNRGTKPSVGVAF